MRPPVAANGTTRQSPGQGRESLTGLVQVVRAFNDEARLAEEMRDLLVRQRTAVAGNDHEALDDSVLAINRTLLTMDEARVLREELLRALSGADDGEIPPLERILGDPAPHQAAAARQRLKTAAHGVAREAAINHRILGRAAEAGDAFLQQLFAAIQTAPEVGYGPSAGADGKSSEALLLDRKA